MLRDIAQALLLGLLLLSCTRPTPGPAEPACCRLEGEWAVALQLDTAELYGGRQPSGRKADGTITFKRSYPLPWAGMPSSSNTSRDDIDLHDSLPADSLRWEAGRYQIDFSHFWSGALAPEPSTTILKGGEDALVEALAFIKQDSLVIMLNPRVTHGGVALVGMLVADSVITGRWQLRGNESHAAGRFQMLRVDLPK